jgi:hypothetical protein
MSDKLESLSQPIGYVGKNCINSVASGNLGYVKPNDAFGESPVYSHEYVTSLLAALEEKDQRIAELQQRLQQPIKLPKGFSHQDGAPHALLGTGDVMISHIKWADAQGIAFAPMPAGKAGIGVNVDADVAGKSSDEIGAVFVVKAASVQSLEVLKEAVQMAIDGFKVEGE